MADFFAADGGRYGRFNRTALSSYVLGIVVQLPFVSTDLFTGPLVAPLGGADLSWLVGLVVTAPVYYFWARPQAAEPHPATAPVPQEEPARTVPTA